MFFPVSNGIVLILSSFLPSPPLPLPLSSPNQPTPFSFFSFINSLGGFFSLLYPPWSPFFPSLSLFLVLWDTERSIHDLLEAGEISISIFICWFLLNSDVWLMPPHLWVSASVLSAYAIDAFVSGGACGLFSSQRKCKVGIALGKVLCHILLITKLPLDVYWCWWPYVIQQIIPLITLPSHGGTYPCYCFHSAMCWHSGPASHSFIKIPNGKWDLNLFFAFGMTQTTWGIFIASFPKFDCDGGEESKTSLDDSLSSPSASFPSAQRALYFFSLGDGNTLFSFLFILQIL